MEKQNPHCEKTIVRTPLVKVLEILKNFFQEVFKQGLGQSPKVFPYHFYPVAGAKRKLTKFRLTEFCAGAAGNSSTEYGYT